MEEAGWDYRQSAILGLAGDGYVIAPWLNKEISDKKNSKSISWLAARGGGCPQAALALRVPLSPL